MAENGIRLVSSNDETVFASDFLHIHKGQGALALDMDTSGNPSLFLVDEKGQTRAQLGTADLKETASGTLIHRSPASLVLFKEDGRVLWETP